MPKRGPYKEYGDKEEALQKIIVAIQNGLHRDSACAVSKVPKRTFYDWMDDEEIRTKVEDAEEYWLGVVEKAKNKLIQEGHRPAIEKELKSKRRDIYGDKQEIDMDVKGNMNFTEMTPNELLEFIKNNS